MKSIAEMKKYINDTKKNITEISENKEIYNEYLKARKINDEFNNHESKKEVKEKEHKKEINLDNFDIKEFINRDADDNKELDIEKLKEKGMLD